MYAVSMLTGRGVLVLFKEKAITIEPTNMKLCTLPKANIASETLGV